MQKLSVLLLEVALQFHLKLLHLSKSTQLWIFSFVLLDCNFRLEIATSF